jgi:hypothetical protein
MTVLEEPVAALFYFSCTAVSDCPLDYCLGHSGPAAKDSEDLADEENLMLMYVIA